MGEFEKSDKDVRFLAYKMILESFNTKYNDLHPRQKEILKELIKPKSNWKEIRQIIANANIQDFEEFYRFLFDHSSEYAPGNEGTIAVLVNEYSYQSNFRIDKEINCMALINQIIKNKQQTRE